MSKTIAISQVGGTPAGSGGAATPAAVTVGTITYGYVWDDGSQSSQRRPTSLNLQIPYTKPGMWTGTGVHAYVEYPDQSSGALFILGTSALGGGNQLGGTWKPDDRGQFADDGSGFITIDLIEIPDQTVNIRVYLVAYNALSDPAVQRATSGTPSPSGVVTVPAPPTFALGEENAQNVTGLSASTQYAVNQAGQLVLQLMVGWTPPVDPNFQGVFIYMHRPAQVVTAPPGTRVGTLQANALDVNSGLQVGTSWTAELSMFPVTSEFNTLYCMSVDTEGNVNSIIVGTTPQVTVEIDPPPQGSAGTEFTSLVTNFTCSIAYTVSGDGVEQYNLTGSATEPTGDQSFGGYQVFAHDQANGSDHTHDWVLGNAATDGSYNFGPYVVQSTPSTLDIYAVSFDVNNNDNTIVPGTTPRVVGISPTLQTTGKIKATRVDTTTVNTTHFGVGTGVFAINTNAIDNTLLQALSVAQANIQNAAVATAQLANGAVTGVKIANATIGTANIANAAITTALIANAAITSALIANLAVGTAAIQNLAVTNAKINDLDVSKLNAGTISVAVTLTTPTLVVTSGTITLNFDATNLIKLVDTSSSSKTQMVAANQFRVGNTADTSFVQMSATNLEIVVSSSTSCALTQSQLQFFTGIGSKFTDGNVVFAGLQVIAARQTGWTAWTGTATRTSFSTGSATLQNVAEALKALLDDLITHGLIGT